MLRSFCNACFWKNPRVKKVVEKSAFNRTSIVTMITGVCIIIGGAVFISTNKALSYTLIFGGLAVVGVGAGMKVTGDKVKNINEPEDTIALKSTPNSTS